MVLTNPFKEIGNSKPVFATIYATILIGILFSSLYVFSALYSSKSADSSGFQFPTIVSNGSVPLVNQLFNVPGSVPASPPNAQGRSMKPIWELPPPALKMPPLGHFKLSKELVERRVKDNVIIVTFGNYAFMDFILTWVKHLTDLGVTNIIVGAMDTKLL